uniref:Uncharacterized protein n=1 Tax=Picea glauca TaxID=3330 RepID=A0A101LTK2_PICGL|nr:hypothetical protein ABT39_MTgene4067 [Picea glauca]KUM45101.1 hypothetical protein ABT39_MTgene4072 [Picea glauca]
MSIPLITQRPFSRASELCRAGAWTSITRPSLKPLISWDLCVISRAMQIIAASASNFRYLS